MDWSTFLASIAGSSVIAGGVSYVLKQTFEHALKAHFEKMNNENKALIQESMRRYAFIYDKQFEVLKLIMSLTYRLRNIVHDLLDAQDRIDSNKHRELLKRFQRYNNALAELLYEERALLPESLFKIAHDLKHIFADIDVNISRINEFEQRDKKTNFELQNSKDHLAKAYKRIDENYVLLVSEVQSNLGLPKE